MLKGNILRTIVSFLILCSYSNVFSHDSTVPETLLRNTIILASEPDYPPYCILDENGQASGFAVDLFKASAAAAGYNVKVEVGPWLSIRQHLLDGKVDALPIVADMPDRRALYEFSIPYFSLQGNVFVNKNGPQIKSLSDLKQAKVFVIKGDNSEEYIREKGYAKQVVTTSTFDEAFQNLANGEADAVITQRIIGSEIIKRLKLKSVVVSSVELPDYRLNFCFAAHKDNAALIDRLNEGLSIVMATGQYNEIHRKWFGPVIHEKLSLADLLKLAFSILIPIVVLFSVVGVLFLRREVRKRTKYLHEEITEHENTLAVLRKQKQLLEASESQIRLLLNSTAEGIYGVNKEGNCILVNKAALDMLGYANEKEVLGKNMHQLIHNTKADGSPYPFEECVVFLSLKTGKEAQEKKDIFRRADGSSFEIEYFSHPIRLDGNIQGAVITFWDITESKKQETALKESEEKFRSLFDNHSAAKLMVDPATYRIIEANQAASELYGYSKKDIVGKSIEIFLTDSIDEFRKRIGLLQNIKKRHGEYRHRRADGTLVDVEVFNSVVKVAGREYIHFIVHDITEKKKNEQQIRLLSTAVGQNPVMMMITDKNGVIQYVNSAFTSITGYSQDEIAGKTPRVLKSGLHPDSFYERLWQTITTGSTGKLEFYNRKKDGTFYWENSTISPIFDDEGEITHFVSIKEDVTKTKELFKDLVKAKEKAEESDRLKSAFIANMSHEIRTPMNSIMGFLELLQAPDLSETDHQEYFRIIKRSSRRLLNTISDIIEISKLESGIIDVSVQLISMDDFLSDLHASFLTDAAEKNLEFEIKNELPEGFRLATDKSKLEIIMLNLLKNAFKFTSVGFVEFGAMPVENNVLLWVKDSGTGIEAHNMNSIFERFRQAELTLTRNYEGSGLGLSIAKSYAELINAKLWCESEFGKGSQFYVQLPVAEVIAKPCSPELN